MLCLRIVSISVAMYCAKRHTTAMKSRSFLRRSSSRQRRPSDGVEFESRRKTLNKRSFVVNVFYMSPRQRVG